MTDDLDSIPWNAPEPRVQLARPRRCRHPRERRTHLEDGGWSCACGHVASREVVRRAKNNRARGNHYELVAARRYGGEKVGPLGGPEDIRGAFWRTQVKTIQGEPPATWSVTRLWSDSFDKMREQNDGRWPRLLLMYLPGSGIKSRDYFVVQRHVAEDAWGPRFGELLAGWLVGSYVVVRGVDWLEFFGADDLEDVA